MSENLLVLVPDKPAEGKTREARKTVYALCGEASLYALPPVIILGKTEKNGFERKSWHKDITLTSADALMSVFGFVLHEEETVTAIQKELGLEVGGLTEDGRFSLEAVRCVGCCGLAPVMTISGEVFGKVSKNQISGILDKFA